jgi:hypothetical protein
MDSRPDHLAPVVEFVETYRRLGLDPRKLQEAVLAEFGWADGSDFAVALIRCNRRRRVTP